MSPRQNFNKKKKTRCLKKIKVIYVVSSPFSLFLSKYRLGSTPGNVLDLKNSKNYSEGVILLIFCVWWAGGLVGDTYFLEYGHYLLYIL